MKVFILLGLVFVVILISGCVYFPDLDIPNSNQSAKTITSNKLSYEIGEPIVFTGEFEQKIYEMNWYKPIIYKKEYGIWSKMDFDCSCITKCDSINMTTTMDRECYNFILFCSPPPLCTEVNPQQVWTWDQTYCNKEKVECIGNYDVYCRHGIEDVGPGTYKIEFSLTRECDSEGSFGTSAEISKIQTNEFTIREPIEY